MRNVRPFIVLVAALLLQASAPGVRASEIGDWIGFVRSEISAHPVGCSQQVDDEFAPRIVRCYTYAGGWSAFKSDWEAVMRHYDLPGGSQVRSAWTLRGGRYQRTYEIEKTEIVVNFRTSAGELLFVHDALDVYDDDELAANARSRRGAGDAPADESPAGPVTAGFGGVSTPQLVPESRVEPDYPEGARAAGLEASVVLDAVILRDGSVGRLKVLSEKPEGWEFGLAALAAVRQWRYQPADKAGVPVDSIFTIYVEFRLPVEAAE